jgi:O-acetyl-ADP-ribose deacetylase (regulator of RNase III)
MTSFLNGRVVVKVGDLTREDVDAIVNAANSSLLGGGGVDGAIHAAGGPQILKECRELRRSQFPDGLPTGQAVITSGGSLTARYVIHTVGPIKGTSDAQDAQLLANCYRNSLHLAVKQKLRTIAFPAISTGIYRYPLDQAAAVASSAIQEFLDSDQQLEQVRLVFFRTADAELFVQHQRFRTQQ